MTPKIPRNLMLMAVNWETESRKKGEEWEHQQWQIIKSVPQNQGNYRSRGCLIPEKNCTEITVISFSFLNIPTRRWPCRSAVLDVGFCVWAMLTPVCYPSVQQPTSGLEETIFSWEKGLPVSAQEKYLSLHCLFMAEETSLKPWLLAHECVPSPCVL